MKKLTIALLAATALLFVGTGASAQVGLGLGATSRFFFQKGQDPTYISGVQIQFDDNMRASDYFGYSAGLDFGTYRKKDYFGKDGSLTEMYLDLPIRLKLYLPFSDDFQPFIFGGPVLSACLGSHTVIGDNKVSRFGEKSTYTRFDILAGGGIGVELFEHLRLALGFDYGLLDRNSSDQLKLNAAAAKFTATYLF